MSNSASDRGWFSTGVMCEILGVGRSALSETWTRTAPPSAIRRNPGRPTLYHAAEIIRHRIDRTATEAAERAGADPDMAGADSPALEQYRAAKARLAELDLAQRRRELLPVGELRQAHAVVSDTLRRAGESLGRMFGAAAQKILDDALTDGEHAVAAVLGVESEVAQ